MPVVRKIRIANPRKRTATKKVRNYKRKRNIQGFVDSEGRFHPKRKRKVSRAKAKTRKGNPIPGLMGGALSIMSNPKRKRNKRRNYAKRRANPAGSVPKQKKSRRRRNPAWSRSLHRRRNYRRNPQFAGFSFLGLMKLGGGALAGGIGTRALTSLVLRDKNTGPRGIGANVAMAALLTFLASKLDLAVASGVAAGSLASIAQRVWDTWIVKVLPDGKGITAIAPAQAKAAISNTPALGDVSYSGDGLGYYENGTSWPGVIVGPNDPGTALLPAPGAAFKPAFPASA
jgi:hypothetical protein